MRLRTTLPCALALVACNAFSEPRDEGSTTDPGMPFPGPGFVGPSVPPTELLPPIGVGGQGGSGFGGSGAGNIQSSPVTPVPIQGGTLLVARDGHTAIAADPERDRVMVADLQDAEVLATLSLQKGDEPGRLVEDGSGRVRVVLRNSGAIATLDLAARALVDRRNACAEPQGIAYRASSDSLLVACAGGELVELPAGGGGATQRVSLDQDLRDVLVSGERVLVSRFKSAELLELDGDLKLVRRSRSPEVSGPFFSPFGMPPPLPPLGPNGELPAPPSFSADVAFRTLLDANGRAIMLHERAQSTEIALQDGTDPHAAEADPGAAGAGFMEPVPFPGDGSEGSPYGGGAGDLCGSIVRPAVSMLGADGMVSGPVLPAATLAVDAAVSPNGRWLAIGVAGSPDISKKSFGLLGQVSALVVETNSLVETAEGQTPSCMLPGNDTSGGTLSMGQVVAVAFDAQNRLIMQTREPSMLRIVSALECLGNCGEDAEIPFGGETRADTGHDLFHGDAGAGIACASCHPGGAEDGHTWVFSGQGPRRTQLFNMGIADTLPLHWDGALASFGDLVAEVFMRRMGGSDLTVSQVQAMNRWIETLHPGAPLRASDDPAVERGRALFESAEVACSSCHTGSMMTNNMTLDVGTGGAFQVPSLIGVSHHAPFIHDGCAQTLRDRFNPECGGAKHGNTSQLDEGQIDDLVAFLESL